MSGIINQMLVLALMTVAGYAANKAKIMNAVTNERLTKVVLNITIPSLIITSTTSAGDGIAKGDLWLILLVAFGTYVVLGALAFLFTKLLRIKGSDAGAYQYMILFGNVGFMGFPVISAIFGPGAVFYCALFNIPFNLLVYSLGRAMISGKSERIKLSPKVLLNTPLITALAAVILFLIGVRLPAPIQNTLDLLGGVTTPAAMLILGSTLAGLPVRELFTDWRVYPYTAVKLFAAPLTIWLLLRLILPEGGTLLGVAVVLSGMPAATNATMLAIEYGGNHTLVSKAVFVSTVLSLVTIPLMAYLLAL